MSFIKLTVIAEEREEDFVLHVRPTLIMEIHTASPKDKKKRSEINSYISLAGRMGGLMPVAENAATIIEKIAQCESSVPRED